MTTNPKFILFIKLDKNGEYYATLQSLNGRTIWKTSESYKVRGNLIKALKFIKKPAVIKYEIHKSIYREKFENLVKRVWD